jgi:4-amino-4-deoxy-L-arabinose transferase-like glycosyltransferase
MIIDTHFQIRDIVFLVTGISFSVLSVFLFVKGKKQLSVVTLFISAFIFRLLMVFIDPFLHEWDEQFHALVALHLKDHWLLPTLFEKEYISSESNSWNCAHIWLHKPPLFLWQIALSIKLFGANIFAVRFPSVLLSALTIPAIYRIGKLAISERVGFLAALFLTISNIHIHVVSGNLNTDHNDVVFMCYVTFSIWAWTEYFFSGKKVFIALIALFVGCAVLTKWLPGLLVFGAWGFSLLLDQEKRTSLREWLRFVVSLVMGICIFLPWTIYTYIKWPELSQLESEQRRTTITSVVEGHDGPWWFHFGEIHEEYTWISWLIIPGIIIMLCDKRISKSFKIPFVSMIVFVFIFFSFVKTRMPLFTFPVSALLILSLAILAEYVLTQMIKYLRKGVTVIWGIAMIFFCIQLLNIGRLEHYHTDRGHSLYRETRTFNDIQLKKAVRELNKNTNVIFNCGGTNPIVLMFYTGLTAYAVTPDEQTITKLEKEKIHIAIFDDGKLPINISADSTIQKLKIPLIRNSF